MSEPDAASGSNRGAGLKVIGATLAFIGLYVAVGMYVQGIVGESQSASAAVGVSPEYGEAVFWGKGKCSTCHAGGNLADDGFHALNVPESPEFERDPRVAATRRFVAKVSGYEDFRSLAEDPGRYLVTRDQQDWKAFRTPTLREISRTAPYMHNGIFSTLEEVIAFIDRGAGEGNRAVKPLGLTDAEKAQLRAFLVEGLTGPAIEVRYPEIP
jgi:cytochrome c peroxidase